MLIVFPPIFLADTKIIYAHNFVVPLTPNFKLQKCLTTCEKKLASSQNFSKISPVGLTARASIT